MRYPRFCFHPKEHEEIKKTLDFFENREDERILYLEDDNGYLKEKLRSLEDRSRRNNLRIDGVAGDEKETWSDTEGKIQQLFTDQLGTPNITIEREHRSGSRNAGKPRTIVMKLLNYKEKERILKNASKLKGTNIFIYEDFSYETTQIRKRLWAKVKALRKSGKYAVLQYDRIVERDGKQNVQNVNASTIDHIITNQLELSVNLKTGIIQSDVSDHFAIFVICDQGFSSKERNKKKIIYKRYSYNGRINKNYETKIRKCRLGLHRKY